MGQFIDNLKAKVLDILLDLLLNLRLANNKFSLIIELI